MMRRVLVTGASGFVGRNLVNQLLARGCEVRCLVRSTSSIRHLRQPGIELCTGNLSTGEGLTTAVSGCDAVFHAAGLTRALRVAELMQVNATGTWHVARACSRQPEPPVLVLVSSLAAAGPSPNGRVRTEADRPAPVSHYGRSKRAAELAAAAWAAHVPLTIVRPGIVFGPWGREMYPLFHSIDRLGIHVIPTFGRTPMSLIHSDDLSELLIRAAERGRRVDAAESDYPTGATHTQGYYFASAPEYPSYAEIGRIVGQSVGRKHVLLLHLADPLPWLIAGVAEIIGRVRQRAETVNLDKMREAYAGSWACSSAAAQQELGVSPPASLVQRMRQTVAWYRQRRWL